MNLAKFSPFFKKNIYIIACTNFDSPKRERERECVCERQRERESVCVREREGVRVSNGGEKETVDDANLKDLR